jgi:hypothetical protein
MADHQEVRAQAVQFLFEQRMQLFNVRRDHEWKILFGVIGLIGAVDVTLVTKSLDLSALALLWWRILLGMLFFSSVTYEFGVQTRNRIDRIVMNSLQNMLCDIIGVRLRDEIRLPVDASAQSELRFPVLPIWHHTYLWAFIWQTLVLSVVCAISWYLPELLSGPK